MTNKNILFALLVASSVSSVVVCVENNDVAAQEASRLTATVQAAQEKLSEVAQVSQEKMSEAAHAAHEKVTDVANAVTEKLEDAREAIAEKVSAK